MANKTNAKELKIQRLYKNSDLKELDRGSFKDYENHFIAFLIDVNFCLLPVYVWLLLFLLIITGVIPPFYFDLLLFAMYGFLFAFCILINPLLTVKWRGQTLGGRLIGLRLVRKNLKPAYPIVLVMREILGLGIPIMVFGYFFSLIGIAVWFIINGLVVLFSPHQQSIFDWILGLVPVYTKKQEERYMRMGDLKTMDEAYTSTADEESELSKSKRRKSSQTVAEDDATKVITDTENTIDEGSTKFISSISESEPIQKQSMQAEDTKVLPVENLSTVSTASGRNEPTIKVARKENRPSDSQKFRQAQQVVIPDIPLKEPALSPIDLHVRSDYSDDGEYTVESLFEQAKAKGIQTLSITDHNCARANTQANVLSRYYGIHYIDGVEIDAQIGLDRVRILGYYIDYNDPVYNDIEQAALAREKDASIERARRFMEETGLKIDLEKIISKSRFNVLTPKHITEMVFNNENVRSLPIVSKYLERYPEKRAREAFMEDYFGKGGSCEVIEQYPLAADIIDTIHKTGGLAVLANWKLEDLSDEIISELLDMGVDGIEVFTPNSDLRTTAFLIKLADSEDLLVTAGSDYHGESQPDKKLGDIRMPKNGLELVSIFTSHQKKIDAKKRRGKTANF